MRGLIGWIRSLVIPTGAGAGTPRTVIGPDIPAELVAYAAAVPVIGPYTLTSVTLAYDAAGNYTYVAFGRNAAAGSLVQITGFVTAAGVVYPLTLANFDGASGNRSDYFNGGPGTYPGSISNALGSATFDSLLGIALTMSGAFITSGNMSQTIGNVSLNVVTARIFQSTAGGQSIPNGGTGTAVIFNSADQDSHGGWSNAQPTRYTAPISGLYLVHCGVPYVANATGTRFVNPRVNGTISSPINRVTAIAGGLPTTVETTAFLPLSAGDYVECMTAQSSGGALNTSVAVAAAPITLPFMYVTRLRELVP